MNNVSCLFAYIPFTPRNSHLQLQTLMLKGICSAPDSEHSCAFILHTNEAIHWHFQRPNHDTRRGASRNLIYKLQSMNIKQICFVVGLTIEKLVYSRTSTAFQRQSKVVADSPEWVSHNELQHSLEAGLAAAALLSCACWSNYHLHPEKLKVKLWPIF